MKKVIGISVGLASLLIGFSAQAATDGSTSTVAHGDSTGDFVVSYEPDLSIRIVGFLDKEFVTHTDEDLVEYLCVNTNGQTSDAEWNGYTVTLDEASSSPCSDATKLCNAANTKSVAVSITAALAGTSVGTVGSYAAYSAGTATTMNNGSINTGATLTDTSCVAANYSLAFKVSMTKAVKEAAEIGIQYSNTYDVTADLV